MADDFITGRTEDLHGDHTSYFYADIDLIPITLLRDLFAAFAMLAMQSNGEQLIPNVAAKWAYQQADAMLAARVTTTED